MKQSFTLKKTILGENLNYLEFAWKYSMCKNRYSILQCCGADKRAPGLTILAATAPAPAPTSATNQKYKMLNTKHKHINVDFNAICS